MRMYSREQEDHVRQAIWKEVHKNYRNPTHFANDNGIAKSWISTFLNTEKDKSLTRAALEQVAKALAVDPDELIRLPKRRAARPEPQPEPEVIEVIEVIGERIADAEEITLLYLARGWGVARSIAAIQDAMTFGDREPRIKGRPARPDHDKTPEPERQTRRKRG